MNRGECAEDVIDLQRRENDRLRAELAVERERREDADEALTIAYMKGAADGKEEARSTVAKLRDALVKARDLIIRHDQVDFYTINRVVAAIDSALKETGGGNE